MNIHDSVTPQPKRRRTHIDTTSNLPSPTMPNINLLVFLLSATTAVADCCYPVGNTPLCGDASIVATTYCGIGKCNVFGCDCDGGCRVDDGTFCTKVLTNAIGCRGRTEDPNDNDCWAYLIAANDQCLQFADAADAAAIANEVEQDKLSCCGS